MLNVVTVYSTDLLDGHKGFRITHRCKKWVSLKRKLSAAGYPMGKMTALANIPCTVADEHGNLLSSSQVIHFDSNDTEVPDRDFDIHLITKKKRKHTKTKTE